MLSLQNLRRVIGLVWCSSPQWAISYTIANILQSLLPLVLLYITKLIIDRIALGIGGYDKLNVITDVTLLLINASLVILLNTFNSVATEICSANLFQRVTDYCQIIIFKKAIAIDLEDYESPENQEVLERANLETPQRLNRILNSLTSICQNSTSLILISLLLISINWIVLAVLIVAGIPTMLIRYWQSKHNYKWRSRQDEIERESSYFGNLLIGNASIKELHIFNLGDFFIQKFSNLKQKIFRERLAMMSYQARYRLMAQSVTGILVLGIYIFIIQETIYGNLKLGDLVLYSQVLQRGQLALSKTIFNLGEVHEHSLFLSDLFAFLALPSSIIRVKGSYPFPKPIQQGFFIENVSFQHKNSERKAIKKINLEIPARGMVALIGENGSGKTTLVKLLCRLYDVTDGNITIDGIDIQKYAVQDLQSQISVMFQDFNCYQLTAKESIWFGDINSTAQIDNIRFNKASQDSGADHVIAGLPKKYETLLGKWFKSGENLSGGQWQKIALARTLFRDAQITILDEPTSSMDAYAEANVFAKLRELAANRLVLVITHRLANIRFADRIYVMHGGEIVESGTHDELMSLGGSYAHLFMLQAKNYQEVDQDV